MDQGGEMSTSSVSRDPRNGKKLVSPSPQRDDPMSFEPDPTEEPVPGRGDSWRTECSNQNCQLQHSMTVDALSLTYPLISPKIHKMVEIYVTC